MIAKIALPIILVILLTHLYFDWAYLRRKPWWLRLCVWLIPLCLVIATWRMASVPDYFPADLATLDAYLHGLMCYVVPAALLALGLLLVHLFRLKGRWPRFLVWVLPVVVVLVWLYGYSVGFRQFEVRHVELSFDDLPEAFDGYRIVQWSDAHVGTLTGSRQPILQRCVDSINAQHADMVAFVGDMQNMRPEELEPHLKLLGSIKARDGVFSVLGNHDYAEYVSDDDFQKNQNVGKTITLQEDMGWKLLRNTFFYVHRGQDSIVVSGMENDGEGRFPQLGNVHAALYGLQRSSFVVMLEHDPTSWRRKILPHSHVQLTLSGHTHAGQMRLFGWSPAALRYHEYDGLYEQGNRKLYVTKGLGGVVPFRLGVPGEIAVITLRVKR